MTIRSDGFHITELGATIISEHIAEHIDNSTSTKRPSPTTNIPQHEKTRNTYQIEHILATKSNIPIEQPNIPI